MDVSWPQRDYMNTMLGLGLQTAEEREYNMIQDLMDIHCVINDNIENFSNWGLNSMYFYLKDTFRAVNNTLHVTERLEVLHLKQGVM
jgi:hypothetical protein